MILKTQRICNGEESDDDPGDVGHWNWANQLSNIYADSLALTSVYVR